jgi:hypothetical protein
MVEICRDMQKMRWQDFLIKVPKKLVVAKNKKYQQVQQTVKTDSTQRAAVHTNKQVAAAVSLTRCSLQLRHNSKQNAKLHLQSSG